MNYESTDDIAASVDGGILRLTLTRPAKKNALNDAMVHLLIEHFSAANMDESVRAILLSAEGASFCVGSDIIARNEKREGQERPRVGTLQRRLPGHAARLVTVMCEVQVPIVCAAQGWVAGLGLAMAVAADFVVVAEDAILWAPFSSRGITPDSGLSWLLPRCIGVSRAREMLLRGIKVDAATAVEWGLAQSVVTRSELEASVQALADELAAGPSVALGLTKSLINHGLGSDLHDQLPREAFGMELSSRTLDFREALAAFREKREASFIGK
jgi:2-(1,2-epoxy-1,2-dihydrophenyl)acetyl-CoA isomerase